MTCSAHEQRSHRADSSATLDRPGLEALEERLLLNAAPTFLNLLADQWASSLDTIVAVGVKAHDADGDLVTVSAGSANGALTVSVLEGTFAQLSFEDSQGRYIGSIFVELFPLLAPNTVERFITLATNEVSDDGAGGVILDPDGTPYYTDVVVHRVIPNFMIQTGDAANGNGTGGSPLGAFADEFDPSLDFSERGVLAMANSGPNTQDSQFFITASPQMHLNNVHTIFGQMICGWDPYDTIINLPRNGQNRPNNPPLLSSVQIYDTIVTVEVAADYAGAGQVTVTLDDGTDTQEASFEALFLGVRPTIDEIDDVIVVAGTAANFTAHANDDGGAAIAWSVTCSNAQAVASVNAAGEVTVTPPANFKGLFKATVWAVEDGDFYGLSPVSRTVYVIVEGDGFDDVDALARQPAAVADYALGTWLDGNRLYVACGSDGLQVVDVSDPANPIMLGVFNTGGTAREVVVAGNTAFVADTYGGLISIDVSDPANMTQLDAATTAGVAAISLAISGDYVFVAEYNAGVGVYLISNPADIIKVATFKQISPGWNLGYAADVALYGNYAYVTDLAGGFVVLDVSNPTAIRVKHSAGTGGSPWGMDIADGRLYIADPYVGLLVYDLRSPAKPKRVGVAPLSGAARVAVTGNVAAVATGTGFSFVDVFDPANMQVEDSFAMTISTTSTWAGQPVAAEGLFYLPLQTDGTAVMDAGILANRMVVRRAATFTEADGTVVSVKASKAVATIYRSAAGDVQSILVEADASGGGSLKFTAKTAFDLGTVSVNGSLKSFDAKMGDQTGAITFTGTVGKLTLREAGNGHSITIGGDTSGKTAVTLYTADDLVLTSATPISALTCNGWQDGGGTVDTVTAPWIGKLNVKAVRNGPVGNFEATLELSGLDAPKGKVLGSASIAGDLNGVKWTLLGSMGKLTVKGTVIGSLITTTGDMQGLTLGATEGSDFQAGLDVAAGQRCATCREDFGNVLARIGSIAIKGLKSAPGANYVADSNFSAAVIGSVKLVNVNFDNGDEAFGFFVLAAGTNKEIGTVSHKGADGQKWSWSLKSGLPFDYPDMTVEVLA